MRGNPRLLLFTLAATCWLAAGPGSGTVREWLACRHNAVHHMAGHHATSPTDGPCFCDQMTGGLDLAVSTAVPTPPVPGLTLVAPAAVPAGPSVFPLPSSPAFTPTPPPPIGLG
jgi:hypothetical protein